MIDPELIKPGRTYSAQRPARIGFISQVWNDREVLWMSSDRQRVQYDSPTVSFGRKQPIVTIEQFAKWAKSDVTELQPEKGWRPA